MQITAAAKSSRFVSTLLEVIKCTN